MKMGGMCFNWKVVAGLAAVGVGIWVVRPSLIAAALPLLLLAACPLSMLFMMRGMGNMGGMGGGQCASQPRPARQPDQTGQPLWPDLARDEQLARLKSRATELRAQHEALAREIARAADARARG